MDDNNSILIQACRRAIHKRIECKWYVTVESSLCYEWLINGEPLIITEDRLKPIIGRLYKITFGTLSEDIFKEDWDDIISLMMDVKYENNKESQKEPLINPDIQKLKDFINC